MYKLIKASEIGLVESLHFSIELMKKSLEATLCVYDQPGTIRHYLDREDFVRLLLPWLESFPVQNFISNFFASKSFFVIYLRSRSPLKNQGQQEFHRDWFVAKERLEVFIALDEINQENGPLEVSTSDGLSKIIEMNPGDTCLIDAEVLHRGTKNLSGKCRRLISLHIGSQLRENENYVSYFKVGD